VKKRLGEWLVEKGLLTEAQLGDVVEAQQHGDGRFLGTILIERGWVKSDTLLAALSEQFQMPSVRLREASIDRALVGRVPLKVAMHYKIMPIRLEGDALTVAIANPQDVRLMDELGLALQQQFAITCVLATEEDILRAIDRFYGVGAETVRDILSDRAGGETDADASSEDGVEDLERQAGDASVVKLVNQLILEAHRSRASDIHLEPYRSRMELRYRIDGKLHRVDLPPSTRQLFPAIVSRVKVMSNLNLVERRMPQDGRASVKVGGEKIDLRVSVLPTPAGESVVIRILPNRPLVELQQLGFQASDMEALEQAIRKPHGLVLVTGPTGSGKTTTLYACLKSINTEERKIITIEDPIEYELEGNTQFQVNPQIGLTFAAGLRSMLRHDPDVMMVGEIRDPETAELAIRIALTGHLVFSTLHTNDAASAVIRLLDMGIDTYLIASSVECVIAQRLVRVLCGACKVASPSAKGGEGAFNAKGCEQCQRTGYSGRIAIYEMIRMSEPIRHMVLEKAPADAIRRTAIKLGMRTMYEDGLEKVRVGVTTVDEVAWVTQEE